MSNVEFTGPLQVPEQSSPGTPPSGFGVFYTSTSGVPRHINDAGTDSDLTTGGGSSDPEIYGTQIQAMYDSANPTGVIDGGAVTPSSGMTLAVASGTLSMDGLRYTINPGTVTIGTAHATLNRIDLVVAHYYGANTVVQGAPLLIPTPAAIPSTAVVLAYVTVPAQDTTISAGQINDARIFVADDSGYGRELRIWNSALANRAKRNANIWLVGDSMTEGYGAPSFDTTWAQLFRSAIQQPYRIGGAGFIKAKDYAAVTADVTPGAPANAHRWVLTGENATFPDVGATFGWGYGLSAAYIDSGGTATLVFYGDGLTVYYLGGSTGTATMTIDGVSQGATNTSLTGILRSVTHTVTGLPVGWHTAVITMSVASVLLEGATVYNVDRGLGVHVWNGSRSQWTTEQFDGSDAGGLDAQWMTIGNQPATNFNSQTGVLTSADNTFTDTNGAFTARDVGEWIMFDSGLVDVIQYGAAKITAFNSSTSVELDRAPTSSANPVSYRMGRSEVATWSITNASNTATSTTAAFTGIDEGKYLIGPAGIPANTYIQRVVNSTTVTLSKPATATASSQTVRILNREAIHASPDLLIVELGINDMTAALSPATYKQNLIDIVNLTKARTATDNCSVLLLGLWAPSSNFVASGIYMNTTNGSNVISLANYPAGYFTSYDVGKTLSAVGNPSGAPTGFAATVTISSVADDGTTAVVSANANSTQNNVPNHINARQWSDQGWQPYRKAMQEAAYEQGYVFWDLYEMGGWIGVNDVSGLTTDGTHPSARGNQWIADRLNSILTGMPKTASIPVGVFNNAGESIIGGTADQARIVPGIKRKVTADTASGTTAGVMVEISEFAFQIAPNETLSFQFNLIWTVAAATSGILFDFNPAAGVSAPADLVMATMGTSAANTLLQAGRTDAAWGTDLTITGGSNAVPNLTTIIGSVTAGAAGGLITPRFGPEANAATTLQRGSFAIIT